MIVYNESSKDDDERVQRKSNFWGKKHNLNDFDVKH